MEVAPFAAVRYRPEAVGRLDEVVSLPYDQFDDTGRDARYAAHPQHVVRLIRPRPGGDEGAPQGDVDAAALHRQAAGTFRRWLDEGVLAPDLGPAIYPYRQRYVVPGSDETRTRWSLLVRVALSDLESGPVRPHERTFPDTVGERSDLRQEVGADLGVVLMVHEDPGGDLHRHVVEAAAGEPLVAVQDEAGVDNALWRCTAAGQVSALVEGLRPCRAIIADGHHRSTAALEHWRGRGGRQDDPARWLLAAVVSEADPGLAILPIHRLLASRLEPEALRKAGRGFAVERLAAGTPSELVPVVRRELDDAGARHAFVVVVREGTDGGQPRVAAHRVRAPVGSQDGADWPAGVPDAWRRLDITILQQLILAPALGERLDDQRHEGGEIAFTNDAGEALAAVAEGSRGTAILLRPLGWEQVRDIVDAGGVLPPKSTNFHPKAIAGLLFSRFEP